MRKILMFVLFILIVFLFISAISSCDCRNCNEKSTDGEVIAILKVDDYWYIYLLIEDDEQITLYSYDIWRYGIIKDSRNYLDGETLHLNKEMINQIKTLTNYGRN